MYPDKDTLDKAAMEQMALEIAANPLASRIQGAKDVFLYQESVSVEQALDYTAARSSMIMPSEDLFEVPWPRTCKNGREISRALENRIHGCC